MSRLNSKFKSQFAVFARRDGEVDEWIEGEHFSQFGRDGVVAEARIVKRESDGWVVVQYLPTMFSIGVAVQ